MDEVGSDIVGIRLSPFTEFYGAYESGEHRYTQHSCTALFAGVPRMLLLFTQFSTQLSSWLRSAAGTLARANTLCPCLVGSWPFVIAWRVGETFTVSQLLAITLSPVIVTVSWRSLTGCLACIKLVCAVADPYCLSKYLMHVYNYLMHEKVSFMYQVLSCYCRFLPFIQLPGA